MPIDNKQQSTVTWMATLLPHRVGEARRMLYVVSVCVVCSYPRCMLCYVLMTNHAAHKNIAPRVIELKLENNTR